MTLGELKRDLRKHGIRVVGVSTIRHPSSVPDESEKVTVYFSSDEKIVFPLKPPSKIYPLVVKSASDDVPVHSEKIKALKRSLIADWDEE
jgi:hypothetical protein